MNSDTDMNTQCNSANMNSDTDMNTQCNCANMNSDTDMNTQCNSANTNSVLDDRHSIVNILATTTNDGGGSPATENLRVHCQSAMSNCVPTCVPNACENSSNGIDNISGKDSPPTNTNYIDGDSSFSPLERFLSKYVSMVLNVHRNHKAY